MIIHLKSLHGSSISLKTHAQATINSLKPDISDKTGIAINLMRLMFDGAALNGLSTLSGSGIQENSTIQLALRTPRS